MPKVIFEYEGITQEVPSGCDFQRIHTLYPHLPLRFGCRRGECGTCAFVVLKGQENLTKVTEEEIVTAARKHLPDQCRLGCQCAINGDVTLAAYKI